jgi:hypothetical protein
MSYTKKQQNQDAKRLILQESEDTPSFCTSQSYVYKKAHFVLYNDMFH